MGFKSTKTVTAVCIDCRTEFTKNAYATTKSRCDICQAKVFHEKRKARWEEEKQAGNAYTKTATFACIDCGDEFERPANSACMVRCRPCAYRRRSEQDRERNQRRRAAWDRAARPSTHKEKDRSVFETSPTIPDGFRYVDAPQAAVAAERLGPAPGIRKPPW